MAQAIQKHHNSCVFNNDTPNIQEVLRAVSAEGILWCRAGAKKAPGASQQSTSHGVLGVPFGALVLVALQVGVGSLFLF